MLSNKTDCEIGHKVSKALNAGIIMKIDKWELKVKKMVIGKEHYEPIVSG